MQCHRMDMSNEFAGRIRAASEWTGQNALRRDLRAARVRRLIQGVYLDAVERESMAARVAAVKLVVNPHTVVCDRTAAWIHGVDVFGYDDQEVLPPVETCAFRGRSRTKRRGVDGRSRDLSERDVMILDGLKVTTPLRTALDLGCGLPRHRALGVIDQFMRKHGLSLEMLRIELPRYAGRRGVVQLRALVQVADPRSESMRESWIRLDIIDAGLPAPELQHWIEIDGVPTYRLDLAYPKHRVAIEYDGEEFHRRTPEQIEHDQERRDWLCAHGWTVIVVTKTDLGEPERWLRLLREALRPSTKRLRWSRDR